MTDKQIIIDASKCEWRTGVEHCGDYECILNKCCDYNCDWYKRRKLEQQLKAKEQECEELKKEIHNLNSTINFIKVTEHSAINKYNKLKQALTEIKNVIGDRNKEGEAFCDDRLYKIEQILQKCEVLDV